MNPGAVTQLIAGITVIIASEPLIRRRVKPNNWYGVRIPAAFQSDAAWYEINAYGGRILRVWGGLVVVLGLVGLFVRHSARVTYNGTAGVITVVSLVITVLKIYQFARRRAH